jgi:D-3-phosphoglycerate dehydrogenase
VARADFISLHLTKTPETVNLFGKELLAKCKPGVRIVNASRGGIIDEDALAEAVRTGHVAGAALDVFATEPTTESPLFELDGVVVTPHLAASTPEAQDKAGVVIAEQVVLALAGRFVPFAVNVAASEAPESVQPYLPLAERLGAIFAGLLDVLPSTIEVEYLGNLADHDTRILTLSVLKGVFGRMSEEPVSYVNAPQIAEARGVEVRESRSTSAQDYLNVITIRGGDHAVGGTLSGARNEPRIVMLDEHTVEVPPADHMLVVRNNDTPGMVGVVGSALGNAGISISDMHLGKRGTEAAMQVLALDRPATAEVLDELRSHPGITSVHFLEL